MDSLKGIGLIIEVFGPEFTLLGRDSHTDLLADIFDRFKEKSYGSGLSSPNFALRIDGRYSDRFFKKPIVEKVERRYVDKSGFGYVQVGIPTSMILASEAEFRDRLYRLLELGATSLVEYAKRKNLNFDDEMYMNDVIYGLKTYKMLAITLEK